MAGRIFIGRVRRRIKNLTLFMEKQQVDNWYRFQIEAHQLLHANRSFENGTRMLQLIILPSFKNAVSWEVVIKVQTIRKTRAKREFQREFFIARTIWRMDTDREKFRDREKSRSPLDRLRPPSPLKPTMEQKEWFIDEATMDRWIDSFSAIQLPVCIQSESAVFDGTTHHFAIYSAGFSATFQWKREAPSKWIGLEERFTATIRQFEEIAKNV